MRLLIARIRLLERMAVSFVLPVVITIMFVTVMMYELAEQVRTATQTVVIVQMQTEIERELVEEVRTATQTVVTPLIIVVAVAE